MKNIMLNAKGLAIAFVGAWLAVWMKLPLPWLLGPLLITLLIGSFGIPNPCHPRWRMTGQVIIGMVLGLYFTPALLNALSIYAMFIVFGILWSLVLSLALASLQYKVNQLDWATAWFASAIGSASEMVNIAEKHQAQVDKVAASHSLRIVILVVLVPIFMGLYFDVTWSAPVLAVATTSVFSTVLLFALALVVAKLFDALNVVNAWILGPLFLVGMLSYFELINQSFPAWFIAFGQLCIGWSLGSKFPFSFIRDNQKFLVFTLIFNFIALALSILLVLSLIQFVSVDEKVLLLGLSPGGIAEMSLMAKVLGLSVPIIVAFQLSRLIFVILTTRFFYRLSQKMFF
ncbi:AbrB family transcriptional regulator [Acinetobacter sp. SFA]|uniref:AbrB family transcriptional regulator n=1 Tax=Acinetobacter sp. SFA TaxID=1805633 RepID=UPI0007D071BA|nr:AbrB family transcriptional regulator [Acinetobacter sp. SFA]OAL76615.1 aminopeptidase [Acinetobacter sp. SFA]